MIKAVEFICDTHPTKEEIEEAINYCISHDCVVYLNYPMFGYMYHDKITANDTVESVMSSYNGRVYGL